MSGCLGLDDAWSTVKESLRAFVPRRHESPFEWAKAHAYNEHNEKYSHKRYPHHGAPGGPFDSAQDPNCRTISLQWGTRLGKTFFGQCMTLYNADVWPIPQMFVSSVEKLAVGVTKRLYKMVAYCTGLTLRFLKAKRERRQDLVEFIESEVFVGWAGSVSTLADKDVKAGHANEIDKWEHPSTAKEADPLKLFDDRFKNHYHSRKVVYESTPTVQGHSRIERLLLSGTNCKLNVPCPHCKRYQVLEFGDGTGIGIVWESSDDSLRKIDVARKTAGYKCQHCGEIAQNHHRGWMVRHGVWAPNGAEIDDAIAFEITDGTRHYVWKGWKSAEWIKSGAPDSNEAASYQLSSLYALSLTWGDVAAEFLSCDSTHLLRNFINQWLARTWEIRKQNREWEEVAARLKGTHLRGTCPDDVAFITVGVDVQADRFVWVACGWAPQGRCILIDYGIAYHWKALPGDPLAIGGKLTGLFEIIAQRWGGGTLPPIHASLAGIDSGHRTKEVYEHCRDFKQKFAPKERWFLKPTKGFDAQESPVLSSRIEDSDNPQLKKLLAESGMKLWKFAKPLWQEDFQGRLDNFRAGEAGAIEIPSNSVGDKTLVMDLMNNGFAENEKGRMVWGKIREHDADDFRDAMVISRVMKYVKIGADEQSVQVLLDARKRPAGVKQREEKPATITMPDGRPYFVGERP